MTGTDHDTRPGPGGRYRSALAELRARGDSQKGVSLYTVYVNRRVGRRLAAAAATVGATPNAVSLLSAAFSFLGIALIALGPVSVPLGLAAGAALVFAFMLDSADGQLARLQGSSSKKGEWIDHVLDCAVKLALHLAVLVAWYRAGDRGAVLLLPMAYQFVAVMLYFGGILVGKFREANPAPDPPGRGSTKRAVMLLPADHGVLCLSFLLWGWQSIFLGAYALLFVLTTGYLVAFYVKWLREMS